VRRNPELLCNLAFGVWNLRLPQFDRVPLGVMQATEPAVGIRLRVNLHRDSRSLQLGRHFVEIPHSKVQHPDFAGIPEIFTRLREGSESGRSCLLCPWGFPVAGWFLQNSQVLLIPKRQGFRILGSKEESADSSHLFHFRSSSYPITNSGSRGGRVDLLLCGWLHSDAELVPSQDEARPEGE